MSKFIDLTWKRFGRLIVIERTGKDKWGKIKWLCRCDCGNEIIVQGSGLRSGDTQSCGCLQKERVTKHGHNKNGKPTGFYQSWHSMIQRCTNPNNINYHNYGGRGITVCDEWREFPNFLRDMIKDWKPGLTLERRKNELGYFKNNCKWVTKKQQNRNKQNTLYAPYKGKERLFIELCEKHNVPYNVVYKRFYKYRWPLEKALTTPVKKYRKRK